MSTTFYQFYPQKPHSEQLMESADNKITGVINNEFACTQEGRPVFQFTDKEERREFVSRWEKTIASVNAVPSSTDLPAKLDPADPTTDRFLKEFNHDARDYGPDRAEERLAYLRSGLDEKDSSTPNRIQDKFIMTNAPLPIRYEYSLEENKEIALKYIEAALKNPELYKEDRALSDKEKDAVDTFGWGKAAAAMNMGDYAVAREALAALEKEHRATTMPHEEKTAMDGKQRLYYDEKLNHSVVPSDAEGKFPADNRNYIEFSNKAALDRYLETNVSRVETLKAVPTTTDLPKELSLESKNIQLHLKIYGVETVDKGTIKHDPKNPEPAQKYLAELRSGLDNKDGAKLNETQKSFLAESAPYLVHKSGNEALALRYIEVSLKEPGKWGDLKPLSEKQHAVLEKHGSPEAKEAIKTGDYAFCRKQLDEMLKKAEKDYKAKPLTDKQQAVIDKHGDEKLKEAVRTGNYGEARDFIASLHTKLEKEYKEKPLTEKQQTVVDKYAPENVKKAVQEGNPGEGRKYIAELHAKIERDYSEKPLTEKQIIVLSKFADKTLVDEVKNGAFGKGRDYLDNLYKNANAEVAKYEKKVGDLAPEDKVNLQKAELFIIQNNHQQHREAIYGETMKSGISTDSLKKFVETLKPEKTNSTIPKSKGMEL